MPFYEDEDVDDLDTQDDLGTDPDRVESNAPDKWENRMREAGFSEDEIADHRRSFVTKRDFTKKTQRASAERRQLEQRLGQLEAAINGRNVNGFNGNGGGNPDLDDIEREIGDLRDKQPEVYDLLKRGLRAASRMGAQTAIAQMAPYVNGVVNVTRQSQVAQQKGRFLERFGKEAAEAWPEVERQANEMLAQGQPVNINAIFQGLDEDFHDDCVARQRERKRRKETNERRYSGSEGFTQQRTRVPMQRPNVQTRKDEDDDDDGSIDFRALADECAREAGIALGR